MIIDTKKIKAALVEELKTLAATDKKRACFVQFGSDAASTVFVRMKMKLAAEVGIEAVHIQKDVFDTAEALQVLAEIIEQAYDGIIVQLPLPAGLDTELIIDSIPAEYDIDMLSEDAKVQYQKATTMRTAPVAAAVQEILWHEKSILIGKKIVVLGKGRLVGEPIMMLLDRQELPYVSLDIDTPLDSCVAAIKEADVIFTGIGVPHSITPDMIKAGVVLIDAGTSEQAGKLVGDSDPACADKASLYTPVPGGVGPLTVICLLRNLFL
jgi:methylenetetrahydrofolate dehydrogenase (NADP+)/methenyltetrahydrofolate cyclohydrolase